MELYFRELQIIAIVFNIISALLLLKVIQKMYQISNLHSHWQSPFMVGGIWTLFIGFGYYLYLTSTVESFLNLNIVGSGFMLIGTMLIYAVVDVCLRSLVDLRGTIVQHEHALNHDVLTQVYNRTFFMQRIREQLEQSRPVMLISIDVLDFKRVNNSLGSPNGDKLLKSIGANLKEIFPDCIVSRTGANEFSLAYFTDDEERIDNIKSQLESLRSFDIKLGDYEIVCNLAVGWSSAAIENIDLDSLIKQTNVALRQSKQDQGLVTQFQTQLNEVEAIQPNLMKLLISDITASRLQLYYQPIIDAKTQQVVGAEALTRWPRESGGFYSPDIFIPIAERADKISTLSLWVIKEAVRNLNAFKRLGLSCVHINLSTKDLLNHKVMAELEYHSTLTKGFVEMIRLEVTESSSLEKGETTERNIKRLRDLGYKFSLDDFGTGYASLSLLKELPVSQLKLDRGFVKDIPSNQENYSIVKMAIELANNLGFSVVAEGVETEQQAKVLCGMSCTYLQGFYYSPALTLDDFSAYVEQSTQKLFQNKQEISQEIIV